MTTTPLIHRERGLTIPSTAVFIAGEIAGTGILALPRAVEDTGWAGLILIVLCAVLSAYTGIILGEAWTLAAELFEDCKGHVQNPYQILGQKTYGKAGRYAVSICLHITMFGGAVVFLLLAAENMETLVKALGHDISFCFWLLMIAGFLVPFTWFGTPKDFWLIAYGATIATASAAVIIVVSISLDAPKQISTQHQKADFKKIALALGTIVFALGGHPAFPTFQMDMKRQKDFKKAVSCGFIIVSLLYIPVTSAGYFVYGKSLNDNILTNLPTGGLSNAVLLLVTIHLLLAIVIVVSPVMQEVEMVLHVPRGFTWKRCVTRTLVVACILFMAETVPKFNSLLSLIGGSSLTMLDFICPILFHMKMHQLKAEADKPATQNKTLETVQASWDEQTNHIPLWRKVLNYEILAIGVLAGVAASVSAIINIVSPDSFSTPCYVNISRAAT
ncbi:amino acid transporter AVT1J-like [Pecten maximus]|uniref:amino acid transporter AVT1J-like n=1 Tax=Pecten maximus TaxID=6579 RepID=UPI001458BD0F|nr:amino acid transporter AVT1J-like [Pecten maximus]